MSAHSFQIVLYVAGDREPDKAALKLAAPDVLIIDLEESVAATNKAAARENLAALVAELSGICRVIVRINSAGGAGDTNAVSDLLVCATLPIEVAILVPKPITLALMTAISHVDAKRELWCMGEEVGFADMLPELVAAVPQLTHIVIGTKDLCESLGIAFDPKSVGARVAIHGIAKAAKLSGLSVIDGVAFGERHVVSEAVRSAVALDFDGIALMRARDISAAKEAISQ
jgi:citrate lyase subunit beta / citryl-CoA lyase